MRKRQDLPVTMSNRKRLLFSLSHKNLPWNSMLLSNNNSRWPKRIRVLTTIIISSSRLLTSYVQHPALKAWLKGPFSSQALSNSTRFPHWPLWPRQSDHNNPQLQLRSHHNSHNLNSNHSSHSNYSHQGLCSLRMGSGAGLNQPRRKSSPICNNCLTNVKSNLRLRITWWALVTPK